MIPFVKVQQNCHGDCYWERGGIPKHKQLGQVSVWHLHSEKCPDSWPRPWSKISEDLQQHSNSWPKAKKLEKRKLQVSGPRFQSSFPIGFIKILVDGWLMCGCNFDACFYFLLSGVRVPNRTCCLNFFHSQGRETIRISREISCFLVCYDFHFFGEYVEEIWRVWFWFAMTLISVCLVCNLKSAGFLVNNQCPRTSQPFLKQCFAWQLFQVNQKYQLLTLPRVSWGNRQPATNHF